MTIQLTPEDEKLIQERLRSGVFHSVAEVIHHALVSSPVPETSSVPRKPRKNLADVLSEPPFAGSELKLERIRDYPRPLDL
jgi:Arc/MetJ-type ribon-helix-helix transcriptional regulator